MTDITIWIDDNQGNLRPAKMVDNGDGTFSFTDAPISSNVSCTRYENSNHSTLVSTVNSYLAGSSKKMHSICYHSLGTLLSGMHYCVITEFD